MMEEGVLDPLLVAKAALSYMSEDAISDMALSEEFIDEEEAESEDGDGPEELDFEQEDEPEGDEDEEEEDW